jgi:cyclase
MNQLRSYVKNLELTIEKIAEAKENGQSIEQIKQDRILKDWESYGSFFITEDRWIDTIYPHSGE